MSSPGEYYNSLPPISKAYGTLCLLTTVAFQFKILPIAYIALMYEKVFYQFQLFTAITTAFTVHSGGERHCPESILAGLLHVHWKLGWVSPWLITVWRLITNFFFLGPFSINFGIRLLMIARYGVQLEDGPFKNRTADFLWMVIFGSLSLLVLSAIPWFESYFLGVSLVFMLLYVWSREFPTANINIYGLVTLKAFYLPWAMLALDVIFGSPLGPDLLGIVAGHLYYFLTVLHPLAGGKYMLRTPFWVHKLVRRFKIGAPSTTRAQPDSNTSGAFRGRSYRVGG